MLHVFPQKVQEKLSKVDFLVLASDGVWSVLSNSVVVETVRDALIKGNTAASAARVLCEKAEQDPLCYDDITAIVVRFK